MKAMSYRTRCMSEMVSLCSSSVSPQNPLMKSLERVTSAYLF